LQVKSCKKYDLTEKLKKKSFLLKKKSFFIKTMSVFKIIQLNVLFMKRFKRDKTQDDKKYINEFVYRSLKEDLPFTNSKN